MTSKQNDCAPRIIDQAVESVTVQNYPEIRVTSQVVDGQLVLTFEGTVLGDVTDVFCGASPRPATMTLFIMDAPGTRDPIEAWWTPDGIENWQPFMRATGGVSQPFFVPPLGARQSYRFRAQIAGTQLSVDPKLILHTKSDC